MTTINEKIKPYQKGKAKFNSLLKLNRWLKKYTYCVDILKIELKGKTIVIDFKMSYLASKLEKLKGYSLTKQYNQLMTDSDTFFKRKEK